MLDMIYEIAPDGDKPIFALVKKIRRVLDQITDLGPLMCKVGEASENAGESCGKDAERKYAADACALMDSIEEQVREFVAAHSVPETTAME